MSGPPEGSGDSPRETRPRIVVAPGPQGAVGSWRYLYDGCGEQALAEARDDARVLAERHRTEAHGGAGSIDITIIGAV